MKKIGLIAFALLIFLIVSCDSKAPESSVVKKDVVTVIDTTREVGPVAQNKGMGCDVGTQFQALYKINKYNEMLDLTSLRSRKQHGDDAILKRYKDKEFGFILGRMTSCNVNVDGTTTLIYAKSEIIATKTKTEIVAIKENGEWKIVLPDKLIDF